METFEAGIFSIFISGHVKHDLNPLSDVSWRVALEEAKAINRELLNGWIGTVGSWVGINRNGEFVAFIENTGNGIRVSFRGE